jgi:virulence-associated protein VagC
VAVALSPSERRLDVTIVRSGDVLTIYPKRTSITETVAKLKALTAPSEIETRDADAQAQGPLGPRLCFAGVPDLEVLA